MRHTVNINGLRMTRERRRKRHLIEQILAEPRYFGDDGPHWVEGRQGRPCTLASEADQRRDDLVKYLRKKGATPAALDLAARLSACRDDLACGSGACPRCARAVQRWLVEAAARFLDQQRQSGRDVTWVSLVPTRSKEGRS